MSDVNVFCFSFSAATENSLTEVSTVYKESGRDHISSFDISGSFSELEPRGLDHGIHGQPEAAAQGECGSKRLVASYADIYNIRTHQFILLVPPGAH